MKKSLALLLTLILTFSSVSILGVGTVSAETQKVGQVILESDFNDADGTNWQATPHQTVTFSDDNGDGVNDYASVKIGTKNAAGLVSSPFNLIPGNEYELTYYIRVPEESVSFMVGSTFYAPTTAFYQPTVNSTGTKVSSVPAVSTVEASNNYYAYSYTDDADETKSWARRKGFTSTWTIDGYAAKNKTTFSNFDYRDYKAVLSATNTDLNAAFANWTKVTVNFTAMAAVEGETSQVTALGFTFDSLKSSDKNYVFDLKDVKLVCTDNGLTAKTILTSDFDNSDGTNWQMSTGAVTYSDDNGDGVNDYASVKVSSTNKGVGLFSAPFNLIPGNEYELTYYIRVPEGSESFNIGGTFYAPTTAFYQPKVNDAGTKVSSVPAVSTVEASNNYYAYSYTDDADATKSWARRKGFTSTWTIDGYAAKNKTNFSNFDYRDYKAVLSATNADINAAFANWTKVTVNFTAMEAVEGETSQVTALAFTFDSLKSDKNYVFDIKDVKLVENPAGAEEPEQPETPEDPEDPEEPADPVETPYISVVDTEGNQHFYGADIGAKVDVKANEDGSNTFTITYDDMDSVNLFKGWYDGDTFLSADTTFTASADVNKDNVKAKILCRSVITGGLGFESYTEKTTSLRVSPEDANQNLHNIAPFDDKWGQMYKSYQQANEWLMPIQVVCGTQRVKYTTDYVDGAYTTDYVNVAPYSGNSMFNFAARGRAVVRKLDNLKPNTNYELSFYVYNTSDWDFLNKAIITDSYEISVGDLYPSSAKVYSAYVANSELSDKNGKAKLKDKNLVQKWSKVTVSFKTDSNDTFVYLQLSQANGNDSGSTSNIFLDNLTCSEIVLGYTGNAIRANVGTVPQALRYKFAIDNAMLEGFAGMTTKKVGVLAVKSDICGDDTLEIGKTYTKNGKVTAVKDVEVTENNFVTDSNSSSNKYFTVALYNIGKKGNSTDYSSYGSDYAVRPYIIYTDANGVESVVYGTTVNANVFNVMLAIFSENKSESDIEIAKGLLEKEEISKEYYKWQPTDGWYLGESKATDYAYSFAVIGDIQKTTRKFPDNLHYIYDWILNNKDSKNIQYAMSMGDLTDANTAAEWDRATEQHDRLQEADLYQSIVRGNHDQVKGFDANITSEKYGEGLYSTFNGMRNTCRRVTISGVKYMVITLDLYPSDEEIAWAEDLIVNNPDYNVVLTTHAYFKNVLGKGKIELETSIRSDYVSNKLAEGQVAADLNSGQEIFDKLVNKYSNIVLVLCGHNDPYDDGPNHRITTREDGSQVVEMMTNFQDMEDRTNRSYGMLAMLYIKADGTVQLEYFSTINGMFYKDDFQFEFKLDLVD